MAKINGLNQRLENGIFKNADEEKKNGIIENIQNIVNRIDENWSQKDIVRFVHVELGKVLVYDNSYSSNLQDKNNEKSEITQISKNRRENLLHDKTKLDTEEQICKGMAEISAAIFKGLGIDAKVIGVEEKGDIDGDTKEKTDEKVVVPEIYSATFEDNNITVGSNEQTKETSSQAKHYYTQINIEGEEPIIEDYLIEDCLSRLKMGESTVDDDIIPGLCSKDNYKDRAEERNPKMNDRFRQKIITELNKEYGDKVSLNDKIKYVFEKMQLEDGEFGFEEANDYFNFMLRNLITQDDLQQMQGNIKRSNLINESSTKADVISIYNINGQNYFIRGNLDKFRDLPQIGPISDDDILKILDSGYEIRGFKDKKIIDDVVNNREQQKEILKEQREIYQGSMEKEDNNGNIKMIDISSLSNEELESTLFHYSLKKDKNSIDGNGLVPKIGRNSKGIDEEKSIFFSKGIEGALETWDVWLKWRSNRLFNPYYQKENKNIKDSIENGTASEEEKREYYYKCEQWNRELISGAYKDDKEKLKFLYKFQMDEMSASNYYALDLIEGKEFSFDEVDESKRKNLSIKDNPKYSTRYKMFEEMYGPYSDLESDKVDKWNMHTILGKQVTVEPERIKQLVLSNGKNDVLSVVQFLYEKYKEITPKEHQVQFDLLDDYMEYVKEKTQDKEYQGFNRNDRIDEASKIAYFHDQKSDVYFQDKANGVNSISDNISNSILNFATNNNQKSRDIQSTQSELKSNYREIEDPTQQIEDNKSIEDN